MDAQQYQSPQRNQGLTEVQSHACQVVRDFIKPSTIDESSILEVLGVDPSVDEPDYAKAHKLLLRLCSETDSWDSVSFKQLKTLGAEQGIEVTVDYFFGQLTATADETDFLVQLPAEIIAEYFVNSPEKRLELSKVMADAVSPADIPLRVHTVFGNTEREIAASAIVAYCREQSGFGTFTVGDLRQFGFEYDSLAMLDGRFFRRVTGNRFLCGGNEEADHLLDFLEDKSQFGPYAADTYPGDLNVLSAAGNIRLTDEGIHLSETFPYQVSYRFLFRVLQDSRD